MACVVAVLASATIAVARATDPVALDAGHSISTQGAISARGVAEFEFNRALALVIDEELRATGHATTLIAVEGRTEDLASRPRRAADAGAALFLSIHHDSAKARFMQEWEFEGRPRRYLDDRFRGFSLFVSRNNMRWREALTCASAIGARMIVAGFSPSRYHADPVLGGEREFADELNGVHFYDNLAVLRRATMPAVLVEAGVIVNRDEESMLARDQTRRRIAAAIAAAMPACLARPQGPE